VASRNGEFGISTGPSVGSRSSITAPEAAAWSLVSHSSAVRIFSSGTSASTPIASHSSAVRVRHSAGNASRRASRTALSVRMRIGSKRSVSPATRTKRSWKSGFASEIITQRPSAHSKLPPPKSSGRPPPCAPRTLRPFAPIAANVASKSGTSTRCPRPSRSRLTSALAMPSPPSSAAKVEAIGIAVNMGAAPSAAGPSR
jgi:hypothetical protein